MTAESLGLLPGQPTDDGEIVFSEPWEAHAFAMAVRLHEQGLFTWPQWAATLADEITRAQQAGDPDTGARYYHHWLAALERHLPGAALEHGARGQWIVGGKTLEQRCEDAQRQSTAMFCAHLRKIAENLAPAIRTVAGREPQKDGRAIGHGTKCIGHRFGDRRAQDPACK